MRLGGAGPLMGRYPRRIKRTRLCVGPNDLRRAKKSCQTYFIQGGESYYERVLHWQRVASYTEIPRSLEVLETECTQQSSSTSGVQPVWSSVFPMGDGAVMERGRIG